MRRPECHQIRALKSLLAIYQTVRRKKMNSPKVAVASGCSTQWQTLDNRAWCTRLGSKRLRLGSSSCTLFVSRGCDSQQCTYLRNSRPSHQGPRPLRRKGRCSTHPPLYGPLHLLNWNSSHKYVSGTITQPRAHEQGRSAMRAPTLWPLYAHVAQLAANPATH